jgi:hypothetical protein
MIFFFFACFWTKTLGRVQRNTCSFACSFFFRLFLFAICKFCENPQFKKIMDCYYSVEVGRTYFGKKIFVFVFLQSSAVLTISLKRKFLVFCFRFARGSVNSSKTLQAQAQCLTDQSCLQYKKCKAVL